MALSKHATNVVVRAAAILTTSEVDSAIFSTNAALDGKVQVYVNFTLGSLTNGIFTPYISDDGTNWYAVSSPGALTLTATGKKAFIVDCNGSKLFKVSTTGTGTVTSSSAKVKIGYRIQ